MEFKERPRRIAGKTIMRTSLLHNHLSPFPAPANAFRFAGRTTALVGMFLCLCLAAPLGAPAQTGAWRWMGGSSTVTQPGVYGTRGVSATGNVPGGRIDAVGWRDASGNFWLFGGWGFDSAGVLGYLDDLWEYNPTIALWRWMGGTSTVPCAGCGQPGVYGTQGVYADNAPGGRELAVGWTDVGGNLWLFGGLDSSGEYLNDFWEYSPSLGQWRWMGGSSSGNQPGVYGTQGVYAPGNIPGGRGEAVSWRDGNGNLWLLGGLGYGSTTVGTYNDLWEYSPSTGQWRWMGGSSTIDQSGNYGTQGVYAAGNVPGSRRGAASWSGGSSNLWLLGGYGYASAGNGGLLNDLWEYNPSTQQWRWMGGSSTIDQSGDYGTQGVYAAGNVPGSRWGAVSWLDADGNLWLVGGSGYGSAGSNGYLDDLWEYSPATGQWRWMGGSSTLSLTDSYRDYYAAAVYGTLGVYAAENVPGSREFAVSWTDAGSNLWLFGGDGYDLTGTGGLLNDLWEYLPAAPILSVTCVEDTYDGDPHSCTGSAAGAGGAAVNGAWSFNPASEINAGSYQVTGTFTSGDPDHDTGAASGTLHIDQATPALNVSCTEVIYDGSPHTCTGSATGVGGAAVTGFWSFSPASETNAGSYPVTGTFTSSNSNYVSGGTVTGTLKIDPAPVTTSPDFSMPATPSGITVTAGRSQTASFAVTPANGFTGTVSFACAAPAAMSEASCSASSVQITGAAAVNSTLTVMTAGPHQVSALRGHGHGLAGMVGTLCMGFIWFGVPASRRRRLGLLMLVVVLLLVLGATSCGGVGGGSGSSGGTTDPGTPAGTYSLTVTATSGTIVHTMNVPVTVTAQ